MPAVFIVCQTLDEQTVLDLPEGFFEYKYIVLDNKGSARWEGGSNRRICANAESALCCDDSWVQTGSSEYIRYAELSTSTRTINEKETSQEGGSSATASQSAIPQAESYESSTRDAMTATDADGIAVAEPQTHTSASASAEESDELRTAANAPDEQPSRQSRSLLLSAISNALSALKGRRSSDHK